ncbi:MAG: DUF177 domain-containing protein [bacterium]
MIDLTNVDISNIKQKLGSELAIEEDIDFATVEDVKLTSPVSIKLHLINRGQVVRITGTLKGEVLLQCSRCLESFNYKLERDFETELCEEKHEIKSERLELKRKDLEKTFYHGDNVNLIDEIRQQIILSLPMKQICKKDCLGLCSNCGVNLNKTICNCSK